MESGAQASVPLIERRIGDDSDGIVVPTYLRTLIAAVMDDPPEVSDLAHEIVDVSIRRGLIRTAEEAIKAASNTGERVDETLIKAEQAIADLSRQDGTGEVSFRDAVSEALETISASFREGKALGHDSGLPSLDEIAGRFLDGDLVIIGGSSGSGKTSLAMQIAEHISHRGHVLMNQLEMTETGLAIRGLAAHTGITASAMEEGHLNEAEIDRLFAYQESAARIDMSIVTRDRTVSQMRARAMALKRTGRLAAVFVDHLRLMETEPGRRYSSEFAAIADHCSGLKKMAKDVDVPVFLICQRTRGSQKREDDTPRSTDLYGGTVEQDADIILQTYRRFDRLKVAEPDAMRDPDAHYRWTQDITKWKDRTEIFQTKRRRGEGNRHRSFRWNAVATRFEEE